MTHIYDRMKNILKSIPKEWYSEKWKKNLIASPRNWKVADCSEYWLEIKKTHKIDWCKQKSWVKDMLQYLSISAYLRRSRALFKILSLLFSAVTPPWGGDFSRFCFLRLSPRAAWSSARGARESYRSCKNNTMAIQRSFFRPTRNSKTKNH